MIPSLVSLHNLNMLIASCAGPRVFSYRKLSTDSRGGSLRLLGHFASQSLARDKCLTYCVVYMHTTDQGLVWI